MSSSYQAICLAHDPAIIVGPEWDNPGAAALAISNRTGPSGPYGDHPNCDLMIGEWSGNIVEIGCPPSSICTYHRDIQWIDVEWLRLYFAALPTLATDIARLGIRQCWSPKRVKLLGPLLEAAYAPITGGNI